MLKFIVAARLYCYMWFLFCSWLNWTNERNEKQNQPQIFAFAAYRKGHFFLFILTLDVQYVGRWRWSVSTVVAECDAEKKKKNAKSFKCIGVSDLVDALRPEKKYLKTHRIQSSQSEWPGWKSPNSICYSNKHTSARHQSNFSRRAFAFALNPNVWCKLDRRSCVRIKMTICLRLVCCVRCCVITNTSGI